MKTEQKINEFMDWLITESHYPHFFLYSFREEIRGKLKELVNLEKADFWANYHSSEVCQCEKPKPTTNPDDGRCWNCGLKLVW